MRQQVAKLAGVSEATVSRVLNGVGPVKEETKQRVLAAAAELGYVPSALAQRFARKKSGNLGVVLPYMAKVSLFSTYYFSEMLGGIGSVAQAKGSDLLLLFREIDQPRDYAALFQSQKVDALIILGARDMALDREALEELAQEGYPFCVLNQRYSPRGEAPPFPTVDADHWSGSRAAVRHLIDIGCKQIAFINGPEDYSNSMDRREGYLSIMEQSGLPALERLMLTGNYSRKSGYELAPQLADMISSGQADAIFAANDRMAIGAMQGLRERGLEAGRDYALCGYDDADAARMACPQLTSVAVPFHEMGRAAAEQLLASESGDHSTTASSELPVQLIIRESTGQYKLKI
ncbi:LacI family DNA-binding transcriptional regulator [Paenibacillus xylaniclasticus]|uniref:LacI family DNA-binding transcriptional regulator n=1 Tax=Paenibacillus xylaniclasticus TaxID=588083 RepID=UPI000FD7A4EE|nr:MULTISPECIES: LacI family DNA-binding transcriptional regulator [Paenibacillus]GFN33359.1 LacI family transcriptional regulator [Paenibacillus curdlanolyticus]